MKFDSTYRAFGCRCSLHQCDAISRWCWRLTGTLTEFLRLPLPPPPPSIGGPSSILSQSLLNDVIPDRGQVVTYNLTEEYSCNMCRMLYIYNSQCHERKTLAHITMTTNNVFEFLASNFYCFFLKLADFLNNYTLGLLLLSALITKFYNFVQILFLGFCFMLRFIIMSFLQYISLSTPRYYLVSFSICSALVFKYMNSSHTSSHIS